MESEENQINEETVEQVQETPTEETQETVAEEPSFDASAFMSDETETQEQTDDEPATEEVVETETEQPVAAEEEEQPQAEAEAEESEEEAEDDQFTEWVLPDLDDNDDSEVPQLEEEPPVFEEEDFVQDEQPVAEEQTNPWQELGEDLGIEVNTKEDVLNAIQQVIQQNTVSDKDETTQTLNSLINLEDKELMTAELKRQGYNKEEIEDELMVLEDNRLLKREARKVRGQLKTVLTNHSNSMRMQAEQEEAQRASEIESNRKELWSTLSKTESMFGGKINKGQKEAHYKYIASGEFLDEVNASHDNVVKAAWLWKYRDQIIKNMSSNGFEKGKKQVLDTLTNPVLSKSTPVPEPDTGDFNPSRFLYNQSDSL